MTYAAAYSHLPVLKMLVEHGGDVLYQGPVSHTRQCVLNLIQHSTRDTNHVHRVYPLHFTGLPMVDPLSVWSTCCPSLERGYLRWTEVVGPAFTVQF